MSTMKAIKGIRDDLARDIVTAQKSQQQMADSLRTLVANLKATEATVAAKVRFLASLDAIQREAEQALVGQQSAAAKPVASKPVVIKPAKKGGRSAKATKAAKADAKAATKVAAKPTTMRPDEVKVRRKMGRPTNAERAARLAAEKAEKAAKKAAALEAKKAAKAAKTAGSKVKKAAAKTAKTAKAGAKVTKVSNPRKAGQQAVASGKRPPIRDAMQTVMGSRQMNAADIFTELKAKGWLPNSSNPLPYIAYLLSSAKDRFERVKEAGRGVYRCKAGAAKASVTKVIEVKADAPEAAKVIEVKADAPKMTADEIVKSMSADEILSSAGILGGATFGG